MQEDKSKPKRMVGLTIFGSILFFLGMLNIAFYTKAGIELPKFPLFLIVAGIIVFGIGTWLQRRGQLKNDTKR